MTIEGEMESGSDSNVNLCDNHKKASILPIITMDEIQLMLRIRHLIGKGIFALFFWDAWARYIL